MPMDVNANLIQGSAHAAEMQHDPDFFNPVTPYISGKLSPSVHCVGMFSGSRVGFREVLDSTSGWIALSGLPRLSQLPWLGPGRQASPGVGD